MNNNVRVRKAGVILMILSLLNLIGCSAIDKDTGNQITTKKKKEQTNQKKTKKNQQKRLTIPHCGVII